MTGSSHTETTNTTPATGSNTLVEWLPWMIAGVLTAFLAGLLCRISLPLPWGTEYMFPEVVAGAKPLTWTWLWEPIYVHRSTIVRAMVYGWGQLTHLDLKLAAFLTLIPYVIATLLCIRTIQKVRGHLRLTDVVLPLLLLNPLQLANIMSMLQLVFVISYYLLVAFFCHLMIVGERAKPRTYIYAILVILIAPHCSAFGFVIGAATVAWVGVNLLFMEGRPSKKRIAVAFAVILAGGLYSGICVPWETIFTQAFQTAPSNFAERTGQALTLGGRLLNGLVFLSLWLGVRPATWLSPWSGLAILVAMGTIMVLVLVRFVRQPGQRMRTSAILLLFTIVMGTAILIAFGKDSGAFARYFTLILPLPVGVYIALEVVQRRTVAHTGQSVLLLLVLATCTLSYSDGMTFYNERYTRHIDFEEWILSGEDPAQFSAPEFAVIDKAAWPTHEIFMRNLDALQHARMAIFRHLWMIFPLHEQHDLNGWTLKDRITLNGLPGVRGTFLNTTACPPLSEATAQSPAFLLETPYIQCRTIITGQISNYTSQHLSIRLLDAKDGAFLTEVHPEPLSTPQYVRLAVKPFIGRMVRLEMVDATPNAAIGVCSIFAIRD